MEKYPFFLEIEYNFRFSDHLKHTPRAYIYGDREIRIEGGERERERKGEIDR